MAKDMSKWFFSKSRADRFAKQLKDNGVKDIVIANDKDGFGQSIIIVKWNVK